MTDERPVPPRWLAPRDPWTFGTRLSIYVVVALVAAVVTFTLGEAMSAGDPSCDMNQYDCDDEIVMLAPIWWSSAVLAAVVAVAAFLEAVLAVRRRASGKY